MIVRKLSLFDLLVEKQWWFKLFLVAVLVVARFATGWNILNIGLIVAMIMILGLRCGSPWIAHQAC